MNSIKLDTNFTMKRKKVTERERERERGERGMVSELNE